MTVECTITEARPKDVWRLPAIELAAAQLLKGHAPQSVLNETTSLEALEKAQREGHLWVALMADLPVGFAHVTLIEPDAAHLEEVDVHPAYGRRGVGTKLMLKVCEWAARLDYEAVTLTTFRHVPWNMPFYERLGFTVVQPRELSTGLRALVGGETRRGLDPSLRVVMRR